MGDAVSEYGIEKVEQQPLVTDPTFIDPSTDPLAGAALIAVVGTPSDGDTPVYDAALGYVVWRAGITADSFLIEGGELLTEDGNAITE
jgi:hypothetical protein